MFTYYSYLFLIERGKFLALDLGGTNFRVLLIHLKGEDDFEMQSKIYAIPQSIMLGSGTQLFDHIAECLANFIKVKFANLNQWYGHVETTAFFCLSFKKPLNFFFEREKSRQIDTRSKKILTDKKITEIQIEKITAVSTCP